MTAPDAETPIDRAFNATDLPHGEFRAFKAGWEAMAVAVVEWLRAKSRFSSSATEAFVYPEVANAIEAEFLPDLCWNCKPHGIAAEHPGGDTQ